MVPLILVIVIAVLAILLAWKTFFVVEQQTITLIERFGKYNRAAHAGLNIKIPFIEWAKGQLSLRVAQLDVEIETKTKDNVFVKFQVSVQYRVKESKVYDAFYKLVDPRLQIRSYVFDVVRAQVPKMELDSVFEQKEIIANAVKDELTDTMQEFGYEIVKALVTDIQPDEKVKSAMNEINERQRLRMAAQEQGEAEKILRVKQAEAEAESKRLQGEGIANQRKAIVEGLRQSVANFQNSVPDSNAQQVMTMVLLTQYFDTIKEIGATNKSTILLPHSPGGLQDIANQIQEAILSAGFVIKGEGK